MIRASEGSRIHLRLRFRQARLRGHGIDSGHPHTFLTRSLA